MDTGLHIRLLRARLLALRRLSVSDLRSPCSSMCSAGSVLWFCTSFVPTFGTQIHLSPCLQSMPCSSRQLYFALAHDWNAASIMKSSLRGASLRLPCILKTISLHFAEFCGAYLSRSACSTDGFLCMHISVVVLLIRIAANLGSLTVSTRGTSTEEPSGVSLHDVSLHARYRKVHPLAIHHKSEALPVRLESRDPDNSWSQNQITKGAATRCEPDPSCPASTETRAFQPWTATAARTGSACRWMTATCKHRLSHSVSRIFVEASITGGSLHY